MIYIILSFNPRHISFYLSTYTSVSLSMVIEHDIIIS